MTMAGKERVWRAESDKKQLCSVKKKHITMRNILLVVDLQKDFIDGTLAVPDAGSVVPVINNVKGGFDRVYFTLDWHPVNHCSFKEFGGIWPAHCVQHTAGASLPDSALQGLDASKIRFILKGFNPVKEEYGAFSRIDAAAQDLFEAGDTVVVCGIAAEYCVLETLKNLYALSQECGFTVKVFMEGTARFSSYDTLLQFMHEAGIEEYR